MKDLHSTSDETDSYYPIDNIKAVIASLSATYNNSLGSIPSEVPTITSIQFASHLGIDHRNLISTIKKYKEYLESFGPLLFKESTFNRSDRGQWAPKDMPNYYCLNEEQSYFLGTLSRNTQHTLKFKKWLINIFSVLKKQSSDNPIYTFNPTEKDISGFVYLVNVKYTDIYKIGFSKNVIKRLSTLQSANYSELVIVERVFSTSARKLEHKVHEYYKANHIRGEWFELSPEEAKEFIYIVNELDKEGEEESPLFIEEENQEILYLFN